jgi:N-acetylglucosamine kinase-like BadF-type ATPase
MRYFLGIDVGSSKTHALIVDETGRCMGFGESGGGNHQSVGYEHLGEVLQQSFATAFKMSGVAAAQIVGAGFGVSGYDFPSDRQDHLQAIASLGLNCPVEVVNDGWNGLFAAATCGIGVNVTAGSGVNCRGRGTNGQEGRVVGNGTDFGEHGGAIEIVFRASQFVNYAWIKRVPPTRLTQIFLEATGAKDEMDLMEGLSNDFYHLSPYLAIEIMEAARAGDHAAIEIIRWSGEELGWLAVSVARQIGMDAEEVEIIQSGSVFKGGELINRPMRDLVLRYCPRAKLIRLNGPPVVGPVILGMKQAGVDGYAVRENIVRNARELVR